MRKGSKTNRFYGQTQKKSYENIYIWFCAKNHDVQAVTQQLHKRSQKWAIGSPFGTCHRMSNDDQCILNVPLGFQPKPISCDHVHSVKLINDTSFFIFKFVDKVFCHTPIIFIIRYPRYPNIFGPKSKTGTGFKIFNAWI